MSRRTTKQRRAARRRTRERREDWEAAMGLRMMFSGRMGRIIEEVNAWMFGFPFAAARPSRKEAVEADSGARTGYPPRES